MTLAAENVNPLSVAPLFVDDWKWQRHKGSLFCQAVVNRTAETWYNTMPDGCSQVLHHDRRHMVIMDSVGSGATCGYKGINGFTLASTFTFLSHVPHDLRCEHTCSVWVCKSALDIKCLPRLFILCAVQHINATDSSAQSILSKALRFGKKWPVILRLVFASVMVGANGMAWNAPLQHFKAFYKQCRNILWWFVPSTWMHSHLRITLGMQF